MPRRTRELMTFPAERWVVERRARNDPRAAWLYDGAFDDQASLAGHLRSHLLFAEAHGKDATAYVRVQYGWVDQFGRWSRGPEMVWPPAAQPEGGG
jgi:hypothetical protein